MGVAMPARMNRLFPKKGAVPIATPIPDTPGGRDHPYLNPAAINGKLDVGKGFFWSKLRLEKK
jgi:hypothetical protein